MADLHFVVKLSSILAILLLKLASAKQDNSTIKPPLNNWAVLVSTSLYWYNYRHVPNVLSIYKNIKRLGIDDSHIILMLTDDFACDARNPWPGAMYDANRNRKNIYGSDVEVDYRGNEVTPENFIRLLTGRHPTGTPGSKKLLTDEGSNILIYVTGHGAEGFLKFQDKLELNDYEFAEVFSQMHRMKRYNEILFIADTCHAESLFLGITAPNIIGIGSSKAGQDSISYAGDSSTGVHVIDRYAYFTQAFLAGLDEAKSRRTPLRDLFKVCPRHQCISDVYVRLDLYKGNPNKAPVSDFFASRQSRHFVEVEKESSWMDLL